MILYPVTITPDRDEIVVAARVQAPELFPHMPRSVWFRFPASCREYVGERADGMVVALFLMAMAYGQDIEVRAPLSARLWHGLEGLQEVLTRLFPDQVKRITIRASDLCTHAPAPVPYAVASAFSGGADSFYTLWSHLAKNDPHPDQRITHGLFIQGLDIADSKNFEVCRSAYEGLFEQLQVGLLTAHTNARSWYAGLDWSWMYVSPLVGTALVLERLLRQFYVPTGSTLDEPAPWGEFTRINRYFSTESLEVIDDGVATQKADKLETLAHWNATYEYLRVCFVKINGLENCCRCRKCVNSMAALELAGALSRYKTFPLPLTHQLIRSLRIPYRARFIYYSVWHKARACGRNDIALDFQIAFILSHCRWILQTGRAGGNKAIRAFRTWRAQPRGLYSQIPRGD